MCYVWERRDRERERTSLLASAKQEMNHTFVFEQQFARPSQNSYEAVKKFSGSLSVSMLKIEPSVSEG